MSNRFPAVTAKQVVRVLKEIGFVFYRTGKGSHEFYIRETDRKMVMVSRHPNETIKRKTLGNILDAAGLTVEEFKKLL
jgi:predicted RNA binding protein YcfA (HicA-like mRNA interferase family)